MSERLRALALAVAIQFVQEAIRAPHPPVCTIFGCTNLVAPVYVLKSVSDTFTFH